MLAIQQSRDSTEFQQLILLERLGQSNLVEIIILVHGITQRLVISILYINLIKRLVDSRYVLALHGAEEGSDKRQMAGLTEHKHCLGQVEFR